MGQEKLQAELLPSESYVPSDAHQTAMPTAIPEAVTMVVAGENGIVLAKGGECDFDPGLLCADTCDAIKLSCTCKDMGSWSKCDPFADNQLENMSKAYGKGYILTALYFIFQITYVISYVIIASSFKKESRRTLSNGMDNYSNGTASGDTYTYPTYSIAILPFSILLLCCVPLISGCWVMSITKRPEMCCCERRCNVGVFACLNMLTWYRQITDFLSLTLVIGAVASGAAYLNFFDILIIWLQLIAMILIMAVNMFFSCFTFRSCLWICDSERRFMSKAEGQRSGVQLV